MSYQIRHQESCGTTQVSCAVCDSDRCTPLYHIPPRRIVKCSECGHEYVNPIPNQKNVPECVFHPTDEISMGTQIDIVFFERLFDSYGIKQGKLLDLGCGLGRLEDGLIGLGWKAENIYLMDNSERNIKILGEKHPSSTIIFGDVQEGIEFSDYFDCIFMVEFLEHLPNPKKALLNALAALKPDGLIVMRGLPNNNSLESYIGKERWKMRQFIHHYHFFNHDTFALYIKKFAGARILEFDTFLQEGYQFYDIVRIARNIGIINESRENEHVTYEGTKINTDELSNIVLDKILSIDYKDYRHRDRLPNNRLSSQSSIEDLEDFFNTISLEQYLSPDISVVIRKVRG